MGDQAEVIVQKLDEILKRSYSLVDFDELTPQQLIQLSNDVFAFVSPSMKMDCAALDPQAVGQAHFEFVTGILNIKITTVKPEDALSAIVSGDSRVLHELLFNVLTKHQECAMRVYLARYLVPVDVPADMLGTDDSIRSLFELNGQLRNEFKRIHKAAETQKKVSGDPQETGKAIKALEHDREQLQQRVVAIQKKFEDAVPTANRESYLNHAEKIRSLNEKIAKNKSRMLNLKEGLKSVEGQLHNAQTRLKGLESESANTDPNELLEQLRVNVREVKGLLNERVPREIEEKREQLAALEAVLNSKVDVEGLKNEVKALTQDIANIETTKRPELSEKEMKSMQVNRQQAALVAKRKQQAQEDMDKIDQERLEIDEKIRAQEKLLEPYAGSKLPRKEEFKAYSQNLRGKSVKYRLMKKELHELRAEFGVLQRTETILRERDDNLEEFLKEYEASHGVSGFRQVSQETVDIAQRKLEVDEMKGKTLDELSKIIDEFVSKITATRSQLAPQIVELRQVREVAQGVTTKYTMKKEVYTSAKASHETELQRIRKDELQFMDTALEAENNYHLTQMEMGLLKISQERAEDDKTRQKPLDKNFNSWKDMLQQRLEVLKISTTKLHDRKADMDQNHPRYIKQMSYFRSLKKLLDAKLASLKREMARAGEERKELGGGANYLKLDQPGVEEVPPPLD